MKTVKTVKAKPIDDGGDINALLMHGDEARRFEQRMGSQRRGIAPAFEFAPPQELPEPAVSRKGILLLIAVFSNILYLAAAARHYFFRSGAMDLAFFDQLAYLISIGSPAKSSITGFHLLADHAAYAMYLVAPLYKLIATPHVLLIVQALALAIGAYPLWRLAILRGLTSGQANAAAFSYLLYPALLATNISDFHPEVLSIPAILFAILAMERNSVVGFILAVGVALGGKEIVALNIVMMGLWMLAFEKKRLFGLIAMVMGAAWFVFATRYVIPHFGAGREASGTRLFTYLGDSVPHIVTGLFTHPDRWLANVLRPAVAMYLLTIFLPVAWGLSPRRLAVLLAALPTMALNILANPSTGENLLTPTAHYSLLVVPFVAMAVVEGLSTGKTLLQHPKRIATWSMLVLLVGFVARARQMSFEQVGSARPSRTAIDRALSMVSPNDAVLTTHELAPHMSERRLLQYVGPIFPFNDAKRFDAILIDRSHQSIRNEPELTDAVLKQINTGRGGNFVEAFREGDVVLYKQKRVTVTTARDE